MKLKFRICPEIRNKDLAGGVAIYLRDLFIYNVDMISMVLKALYIVLLIVFWYLNIAFTAIVSFLRVSFFGL